MTTGCKLGTKNALGISAVACLVNVVYFTCLFHYLFQCMRPVEDVLALILFVLLQLCLLINILRNNCSFIVYLKTKLYIANMATTL